jgi:hypothetical protein
LPTTAEEIVVSRNGGTDVEAETDDKLNPPKPLISAKLHSQTQEELSKKLEEFRIKSRSTKARCQCYKTFYRSNLLLFHGHIIILYYKATLPW